MTQVMTKIERKGPVTIYCSGMLGVKKIEAREVAIELRHYAQYPVAAHVTFRRNRERLNRGFVESNNPSLLVLEGWGHPDPDSIYLPGEDRGDVVVSRGRYSACDPRWRSDFDAKIAGYLATLPEGAVLADYRNGFPTP